MFRNGLKMQIPARTPYYFPGAAQFRSEMSEFNTAFYLKHFGV